MSKQRMRSKKKVLKPLPRFATEEAESEFWDTHDSTDYIDWTKAERGTLFPNLKPTSQTISLRLPVMMIAQLKTLANKRDVPYQSLLKMFVAERLEAELNRGQRAKRPSHGSALESRSAS